MLIYVVKNRDDVLLILRKKGLDIEDGEPKFAIFLFKVALSANKLCRSWNARGKS